MFVNNIVYGDLCQLESLNHIDLESTQSRTIKRSDTFTASFSSINTDFIKQLYDSEKSCKAEMILGCEQKRKHKKRRINKKWAKRYGYYDVVLTGNLQEHSVDRIDALHPQHSFTLENPVVVRRESK